MSDNKEKDKEVKKLRGGDGRRLEKQIANAFKDLPVATKMPGETLNDLNDLLEWVLSPRIHWDNFAVTIPVKNPNEIKWFALRVSEA